MHGNHHHHHQRTDLGGIMSITSVFTIGPFVPCTPLCKILNTPVMSICLVKQNDGTWVEKHQLFYSTFTNVFLFLSRFFTFIFFSGTFFTSMLYIYRGTKPLFVQYRVSQKNRKKFSAPLTFQSWVVESRRFHKTVQKLIANTKNRIGLVWILP